VVLLQDYVRLLSEQVAKLAKADKTFKQKRLPSLFRLSDGKQTDALWAELGGDEAASTPQRTHMFTLNGTGEMEKETKGEVLGKTKAQYSIRETLQPSLSSPHGLSKVDRVSTRSPIIHDGFGSQRVNNIWSDNRVLPQTKPSEQQWVILLKCIYLKELLSTSVASGVMRVWSTIPEDTPTATYWSRAIAEVRVGLRGIQIIDYMKAIVSTARQNKTPFREWFTVVVTLHRKCMEGIGPSTVWLNATVKSVRLWKQVLLEFSTHQEREQIVDKAFVKQVNSVQAMFTEIHTVLNNRIKEQKENLKLYHSSTKPKQVQQKGKCNFCGRVGHEEKDCRKKKNGTKQTAGLQTTPKKKWTKKLAPKMYDDYKRNGKCFGCGKTGHIRSKCTEDEGNEANKN